jgi:hypothetical protein
VPLGIWVLFESVPLGYTVVVPIAVGYPLTAHLAPDAPKDAMGTGHELLCGSRLDCEYFVAQITFFHPTGFT